MQDRLGNLHDALGRFARGGRQRAKAADFGERPGNREHESRRAASAFQLPTPAAERRDRKERIAGEARQVRSQYARLASGQLSRGERENISYQSPRKRAESKARTGDVVMPRREALRRNTSLKRDLSEHRPPRVGTERTFTGKPKVVRAYGPEAGVRLTSTAKAMIVRRDDLRDQFSTKSPRRTARQVMAAATPGQRSAAVTAKPKVDPSKFTLMPDSKLREIATGMGITLPKRAGRNQIIKLITGAN